MSLETKNIKTQEGQIKSEQIIPKIRRFYYAESPLPYPANSSIPFPWIKINGIFIKTKISDDVYCKGNVYYYFNKEDNKKHYFCANIDIFIKHQEPKPYRYRYEVILGGSTTIEELALQFCEEMSIVISIYNGECYVNNRPEYAILNYKIPRKSNIIFTTISSDLKFVTLKYKPCIPWNIYPNHCILDDAVQTLTISLSEPSFRGIRDYLNFSPSITKIMYSEEFKTDSVDSVTVYIAKS